MKDNATIERLANEIVRKYWQRHMDKQIGQLCKQGEIGYTQALAAVGKALEPLVVTAQQSWNEHLERMKSEAGNE